VAAVIDVKTDLSTQDLVDLTRIPVVIPNSESGLFCGQCGGVAQVFCTVRPLTPSDVPGKKTGVTLLPIRDFYIWGNLPHLRRRPRMLQYSHTSRQSGSPLERWSAFANLRSSTNFAKVIRMLSCSLCHGIWFTYLLISRSMDTFTQSHVVRPWLSILLLVGDYGELRHLRLGPVDLPVGFGIKAGLFTSWIILFWFHNRSRHVTKDQSGSLQDHFDKRPGICHSI